MACDPKSSRSVLRWLIMAPLAAIVASAIWQLSLAADDPPAARSDDAPRVLRITGVVKDASVGRPISGAKVSIEQDIGASGERKLVSRFELVTDAEGRFSFAWRTDNPQNLAKLLDGYNRDGWLFLIKARHAEYLPNYAWSMIAAEELPGFDAPDGFARRAPTGDPAERQVTVLDLQPGKSVTGVVEGPDGKPLPGIKVLAHSQVPKSERQLIARVPQAEHPVPATDETRTDESGRFEAAMITPGVGMLSIEPEKDFAPAKHFVYDQRGDLGIIKLQRGAVIRGKLVDAEGEPRAAVQVTAFPWNVVPPRISDRYSDRYPIDEEIHAAAMTDAEGSFTLKPLPAGQYRVEPVAYSESTRKVNENGQYYNEYHAVPGIFVPQKVRLVDGQDPQSIELRAVPTISIEGRLSYSPLNAPANAVLAQQAFGVSNIRTLLNSGENPTIQGIFAGLPYRATVRVVDNDGSFKVAVPKGLTETVVEIPTGVGGRNMQAQWRLGQDGPLQNTPKIRLGTLERDFRDLEFVYSPVPPAQRFNQGVPPGAAVGQPAQQPVAGGFGGGRAAPAGRAAATARAGRGGGRGGAAGQVQQPVEQAGEQKKADAEK